MLVGVIYPCALNELQVVVQRKHVVQHGECHDSVVAGRCATEEKVKLSEETSKRRNTCEAEHSDGQCNRECRLLLGKSAQGIEGFFAVVADDAENEEREVVRNGIHEQVVDNGCLSHDGITEESNHDIARLRNGTVGHEATEPALLEGAEVTDEQGRACKKGDERGNLFLDGGERTVDQNDEERNRGRLGGHRENGGHGRRRTFVNVGGPGVKGEQRQLEANACEQEQDCNP